ncbi:hypothetical protein SEA_RUDY_9 [Microbacterium phage Rudy]|uniref:Uncharacterized protein n=1 Tax=Microbacterium phage Judebell TaxID=3230835 RepID=A0AAU8EFM1_9CAUD|nr:hypothetical protein SEA_RUDY_9 [Microbacterium phage Rudy]QQO39412.1 hypothetical protein SEA_NAMAGO_11 [Microbacterium phage Namago]QQO39520.1 hypothetical protein SEA_PHABIA_11 [Microbacterium phage Phabia]QWY80498.1 hypothetical protein SEA_QUAMMI_9 [Microbacterium phage Quammi]UVG33855.1 hypothetical protein SEA_VICEROY_10 [Microbacterium phage Viceroy]WKW84879.1 hypothetical protein SEA_SALLYK_12 [Microbacterium phage SallyK]WNM75121.1 hypothetical protein SEA_LONELYSOIL_10 [Microbac
MIDIDQAIEVKVSVSDWSDLGRLLAEQVSSDQAEFLLGFYEGIADAQLIYIGQEKGFDAERTDVASVLHLLATYIETGGA